MRLRLPVLFTASLWLLAAVAAAHGGIYKGPPDVVPPGPGNGGGRSPSGPSGPSTGQPGGPGTPRPSGSGPTQPGGRTGGPQPPGAPGAQPGRTGPRGIQLDEDLTTWNYWWEANKDRYLQLRAAVHDGGVQTGDDEFWLGHTRRDSARDTQRPTQEQIVREVLPALKRALDRTEQRDITSSCMVALAKAGVAPADFALADVFAARLRRGDQEVRETAALALGIAGNAGARELELLEGLVADSATGRRACGGDSVDERTRAFAGFALGLLAERTTNLAVKQKVAAVLLPQLRADASRNVAVAAIHGLGALQLVGSDPATAKLRDEVIAALEAFYQRDLGAGRKVLQAHCPTAIAKLAGRGTPQARQFAKAYARDLRGEHPHHGKHADIARSCALALGQLGGADDAALREVLLQAWREHGDVQARSFAILAVGQLGGPDSRTALLRELPKAKKGQERPWVALALGVLEHARRAAAAERGADPDGEVVATLRAEFGAAKEPWLRGALAVALGLCGATEVGDELLAALDESIAKEELAGWLCHGLCLLPEPRAKAPLRRILVEETRRFVLVPQAAIALGRLGDKAAAGVLQDQLAADGNLATMAAAARGLGAIGDRRSIGALVALLDDEGRSDLPRAFAAAALGGVADARLLPWNSVYAANLNYRAVVDTLANGQSGILDIL